VKLGLATAAAALLPRRLLGVEGEPLSGSLLAVARGDRTRLVQAALEQLGGIEEFVKPGDKVCLKPNISFAANAECGATTSAEVVRQVVTQCLAAGAARVFIVDHTLASAQLCVEKSGVEQAVVDKEKVSIVTLAKERQFVEVKVAQGRELKSTSVARVVLETDKFVNLPVAKSHSATGVSLGMKNLMGLVWNRGAFHSLNLHQCIADLATVLKPQLTIVDATRALTSGGPGGPGKTVQLNTVVAGIDPVAVDAYAVGLTQWYSKSFTGRSVKYIVAAAGHGLGEIDPARMNIKEVKV
jgi:uncharacterized protein (DUF362 family)